MIPRTSDPVLRAVIFDYGNTLVGIDPATPSWRTDYADVVARPCAERLAEHLGERGLRFGRGGKDAFIERFLEIRERNRLTADRTGREISAMESLEEALGEADAPPITTVAIDEALRAYFTYEEGRIVALEGALETLEFLRDAGIPTALLSNATDGRYIERVATRLGMRPLLDPFVVSADIGVRKPRAEAFRAVLDRWLLPADSVAMVGDSLYHDVDGANRLGLRSIHLTQIVNPGDTEHREAILPWLTADTHQALRSALASRLDGKP